MKTLSRTFLIVGTCGLLSGCFATGPIGLGLAASAHLFKAQLSSSPDQVAKGNNNGPISIKELLAKVRGEEIDNGARKITAVQSVKNLDHSNSLRADVNLTMIKDKVDQPSIERLRLRLMTLEPDRSHSATILVGAKPTTSLRHLTNVRLNSNNSIQGSEVSPVSFRANQVFFDPKAQLISASGKVEILHKGHLLYADKIFYDKASNIVNAVGNISILEPDGNVKFFKSLKITGELRDRFIEDTKTILSSSEPTTLLKAHVATRQLEAILPSHINLDSIQIDPKTTLGILRLKIFGKSSNA